MSLPDRIDFTILTDGRVAVLKLQQHNARAIPIDHSIKPASFDLGAALAWCSEHGYHVRQWPAGTRLYGGARAWQGAPKPIRTRNQIQRMRDRYPCAQIDFAYDA